MESRPHTEPVDKRSAPTRQATYEAMLYHVLVPFVATRIMLVLVAWLAMSLLRHPAVPGSWEINAHGATTAIQGHVSSDVQPLLNMWSRWDAGWYLGVAKNGYSFVPGQFSNTAFYPFFPLCMRLVHAVIPTNSDGSWLLAGIIASNAALLIALVLTYLLVKDEFEQDTAARVVLYLLVFPTTLFLSAVYSESLFLAFLVASFYYGRRNRWWLAGVCGGAATLTRSPGILLAVPLAILYLQQRDWKIRRIGFDATAIGLVPIALAGYSAYLGVRFHNPMAIRDAQAVWGRKLTWPWETVAEFFHGPLAVHSGGHSLVDFGFTIVFCLLTIAVAKRLSSAYLAYTLSCLLFITAWGSFVSVPRYVLMMVPCFIVLGVLGRNLVTHTVIVVLSSGLAAFFMMLFALWDWVS